ncbi:MAG: holo-ACP synthase [Candidatus Promineifilaceae bacterium]
MLSVGVDMIEIARIERAIARHGDRFYTRFFTPAEQEFCKDRPEQLAGRFVIKEAVGKALGTGIGDVNWTDIEVVSNGRGKPELVLHNQAETLAAELGLHEWSISLSHTATHAIGFAVAMGKGSK